MDHVLIDTSLYRADPKRNKPEFRALTRLARARGVQLHVPQFVKEEFLSQQRHDISGEIASIKAAADAILRKTASADSKVYAEAIKASAAQIEQQALKWTTNELQAWIDECHAIEHSVQPSVLFLK